MNREILCGKAAKQGDISKFVSVPAQLLSLTPTPLSPWERVARR